MKKITLIALALAAAGVLGMKAQTSCTDLNGFVNWKNTGPTGNFTLMSGFQESAAQAYNYSGPGKLMGARIYGYYPGPFAGVPLTVYVYKVVGNRPTGVIDSVNTVW